uniref:non-specific serine/threonine protein kinase n=1 Tax=Sinocyclocheilus grahami TaxID=75366 RepID=A0A672K7J1_SINGR
FKNDKQGENEEDYDDDEWHWNESGGGDFTKRYTAMRAGNNPQVFVKERSSNKISLKISTPSDKVLRKFENKINLDKLSYADSVINKVTVLDPRTRMILIKMLSRGIFSEINGCISTGKEASLVFPTFVYNAHPFISRLQTAQIPSPEPIMLRNQVLVMSFIGRDDMPAPLLKNAVLSESKVWELYLQIIQNMRIMYNEARLVHADLTLLCSVSQSVEHDHPHDLEFLRKDCSNVNGNYTKHNVAVMTVRELFEFITDPSITSDNSNQYLDKVSETAEERSNQDKVDEEVFKKAYIPRTLTEVTHYERDVDAMLKKKEEASSEDTNTDNVCLTTLNEK